MKMPVTKWIQILLNRNEYGNKYLPSKKGKVNAEYYPILNVGDVLAPVIVEWMLSRQKIDTTKQLSSTKHLISVGSVISHCLYDTTVWGSGVLKEFYFIRIITQRIFFGRKMDFRAIRGPVSRNIVRSAGYSCPEVYGDPAVLMPIIFPIDRDSVKTKYNVSIVLHHRTAIAENMPDNKAAYRIGISSKDIEKYGIHFIDPKTDDYRFFISELVSSKLVISSSLHGIILAEAYGIPTVFLNWGVDDQLIKFNDWYFSTGRQTKGHPAIREALNAAPMPLPDLRSMRSALLRSFPYDLWESDALSVKQERN